MGSTPAELVRRLLRGEALAHLDVELSAHHDAFMRTTLTLDPDVARMLANEAHRLRKPFKQDAKPEGSRVSGQTVCYRWCHGQGEFDAR
jgi:hypothetical protein